MLRQGSHLCPFSELRKGLHANRGTDWILWSTWATHLYAELTMDVLSMLKKGSQNVTNWKQMMMTENDTREENEALFWLLIKNCFSETNLENMCDTIFEGLVAVPVSLVPAEECRVSEDQEAGVWCRQPCGRQTTLLIGCMACTLTIA